MYYEIYLSDIYGAIFHAIVKERYPNGYEILHIFENRGGWKTPIRIDDNWIVKEDTEVKRKYPEYFI